MKLLSIIIPTKNEELFIKGILDSILQQKTNFDYEIIIADNNSTDNTRKIALQYTDIILTEGGIPSIARNNGSKKAQGKWLLFLDADTILVPNSLQTWMNTMKLTKNKLGIPYVQLRKDENNILAKAYYSLSKIGYKISNCTIGGCLLIEKETFCKVNGFDENMILLEDVDLLEKLGKITQKTILTPHCETSARRFEKIGGLKVIVTSTIIYLLYKLGGKKYINYYNKIYKL